ncbi:MAG: hypothetical protein ABIQ93_05535, partial [Saprospiraceae bacterium]
YSDSLHIVTLQHYLDRVNGCKEPKPYPVQFRLKAFQCNYQADTIQQLYRSIAADTNIVLVVDNTWGRYIRNAETIIRAGVPVIALSADQNKLDFGDHAIFLAPSDPQPNFLVQFIDTVLTAKRPGLSTDPASISKRIGFVTECDYLLHQRFVESMRRNGLTYDSVCLWQRSYIRNREVPLDSVASMERSLRKLLNQAQPSIILLNTHGGYGDCIMRFLEKTRLPYPKTFVGIQTSMTDQELEQIALKTGHTFIRYVSGEEALPNEVYFDKKAVKAHYPRAFIHSGKEDEDKAKKERERQREKQADNSLKRCFDAMNIFESALRAKAVNRSQLITYFKDHLKYHKVTLYNELYAFDEQLILQQDPRFEEISKGTTRSCAIQINAAGCPVPDLRVGIDVVDINDVNVRENTFDCNLLYWVIADSQYISKEGYIDFANISSEEGNRYQIAEEHSGKYAVRIHRISGKFLGHFKSFNFPFDQHELIIPISALASSDNIKISFDYSRLQIHDKIKDFEMNDWDSEEYYVTLDNQITNALGSPNKVTFDPDDKAKYLEKYKTLNIHLRVSRQPWGAIILIVLPFLMFSALPIFMLFFHKASYEEVGELIITSFLATVAYSINLVQISPATDSMNLAYIFLMLTLGINFFCFIYVTYIDRQRGATIRPVTETADNPKTGMFRFGRKIWLPYLLLVFLVMLFYLIFRQ